MSDPSLLDGAVTTAAAGTGAGGSFFALRWLVQWLTARADKRQAELDAEHDALDISWKDYRKLLEQDRQDLRATMAKIENQNRALRLSFEHVAGALIRVDPGNPALGIADRLMAAAFPTDFSFGVTMAGAALDGADRKRAKE